MLGFIHQPVNWILSLTHSAATTVRIINFLVFSLTIGNKIKSIWLLYNI
uniref:Uncharacterized protein n=1 Tax=Tetranychus urticae TaxID=32264 RepID=T1JSF8_TETUR